MTSGRRRRSPKGFGVPGSAFTYAIGKLVLWSKEPGLVKGEATLRKAGTFSKLSICNPVAAPYGAAAVETMKALKLYDALQPKLVVGATTSPRPSSSWTPAMPKSASSRCRRSHDDQAGSRWMVPQDLYTPIRQDAVLLKKGAGNAAATAFMTFLKGPEAQGHHPEIRLRDRGGEVAAQVDALSPEIWTAIRLTIELAAITTLILLLVGTPIAWWLARSQRLVEGGRRHRRRAAAGAAADRARLLPARPARPERTRRPHRRLWGARTLAFTFPGLVIGSVVYSMPFVVQPIRNAFAAMGARPLEVAATLRASPARAFWTVAVPLARPGFLTGAVLGFAHTVGEFGVVLMIGGNIPGRTKVLSVAIYDYVETAQMARGEHPRRRHGRRSPSRSSWPMTLIEKRVGQRAR